MLAQLISRPDDKSKIWSIQNQYVGKINRYVFKSLDRVGHRDGI